MAVSDEQKAKLEAENEERRKENQQAATDPPNPEPGSETRPRSRGLTRYVVLQAMDDGEGTDYKTFKVVVTRIEARTPEQALEAAQERAPDLSKSAALVAVPESSFHLFTPATSWKRV